MSQSFRALIVDDEDLYAQAIGREIGRQGITFDLAYNCREALQLVGSHRYGVILLDHRLPDDDGIRIIPQLLARQPDAALVMMTAYQTIQNAVRAIRHGAEDYIVKEASVAPILDRVVELRRRAQIRETSLGSAEQKARGLLGRSIAMRRVIEQLKKVARANDTTLLLTGETGVGKEVACRYVHALSRPPHAPLVVVDCLSLPEHMAETLLFGQQRGSFEVGPDDPIGAFEEAGEGTVFLDEISDLARCQGKLLRVVENRAFCRLGSTREIPMRARIVAATNQDLAALVHNGRFRQDLFQRLSVFPVHIPPLRERGEDILHLADHFRLHFSERMKKIVEPLSAEVNEVLAGYNYPGNVRELKNIMERAVILTESSRIELKHLPDRIFSATSEPPVERDRSVQAVPGVDHLADVEVRMIQQAMSRAGNVRTEAAKMLGISRFQLLRRMQKFGLKA
jgi:DNA-binding NtrC family response regulator